MRKLAYARASAVIRELVSRIHAANNPVKLASICESPVGIKPDISSTNWVPVPIAGVWTPPSPAGYF